MDKLRLQDLAVFDHLRPSVYIFYGIKVYKKSIFLTTYPLPLVNVVCERPQSIKCVLCNSSVENCYFNKGAKKQRLCFRNIIEVLRGQQIKLIPDVSN